MLKNIVPYLNTGSRYCWRLRSGAVWSAESSAKVAFPLHRVTGLQGRCADAQRPCIGTWVRGYQSGLPSALISLVQLSSISFTTLSGIGT